MRAALGAIRRTDDEELLRFARQIGYRGIVVNTPLDVPGDRAWKAVDLIAMRQRVAEHDLFVEAIENTPLDFYREVILGGPDSERQLEDYCATVAAVGEAGIPILGVHWMANDVWRTALEAPGRGGALVTAFDLALVGDPDEPTHGRQYGVEEMWDRFEHFLAAVLPVAEEAGVRLALHPDDPPLPSLGGIPRLFSSPEGLQRAVDLAAGSPAFGLDFCVGTVSEMGPGAIQVLRRFVQQGAVAFVHLRDVQGFVPSFEECFLGEGNLDPLELLRALREDGFTGFVIDDHVPGLVGDPPIESEWIRSKYAYRGRAYSNGLIQGMLAAVLSESEATKGSS